MQKRELWLEYKIRKKDHVAISIIICAYFSSRKKKQCMNFVRWKTHLKIYSMSKCSRLEQ